MSHKTTTILIPPALSNSSCSHPRYATSGPPITWGSVTEATFVLLLTVGICGANILVIIVINTRRYSKYIHSQPRYLLTCLASNDLAVGLLVTSVAFLPALLTCWPYSEIICQIQALLRGALTQQSAMILIYMAVDRYTCMLHPVKYHKHASKKGCMFLISLTLVSSLSVFAMLVLPRGGYYHNSTGLLACDPFYPRPSFRILAACLFYFPTTMLLMYCYGSAFHVNRLRLRRSVVGSIVSAPDELTGSTIERMTGFFQDQPHIDRIMNPCQHDDNPMSFI
ncbi:hypothetical protein M8J75_001943 [Diaphorina citri]|nr:hypothetical protein M8J75_001943 [Diaphorina citri]